MRKSIIAIIFITCLCISSIAIYYWYINSNTSSDNDNDDDNSSQLTTNNFIIDHNCLALDQIPDGWIDTVQETIKKQYAHTSHGGQITTGLSRLESADSTYSQNRGLMTLPFEEGALCIFDGQEYDTYITPDEYWESEAGINSTYDVINNNPTISVSMWCWCRQVGYYSTEQIQTYLEQMDEFEKNCTKNGRNVKFIYMTGNADRGHYDEGTPAEAGNENPSEGYQRYINNQLIREYCRVNNKILLDFADIECWLYNENGNAYDYATYEYDTGDGIVSVPKRHWNYSNVSQSAHTTYENCENKAKAFWWMLARIVGWEGN